MLTTTTYRRIPTDLDAIKVTEANMADVAGWANGVIKETDEGRLYIAIDVVKPGNDRQTQAFVGDWVIYSPQGGGFKIYMDRPFRQNFEQSSVEMKFHDITPRPFVRKIKEVVTKKAESVPEHPKPSPPAPTNIPAPAEITVANENVSASN